MLKAYLSAYSSSLSAFMISKTHTVAQKFCGSRAGGNGTAGTTMAVPAFEGENWRRLDSNLHVLSEQFTVASDV